MRLPSYLTLGGTGTKIKPFTEHSSKITFKLTAPDGVTLQQTGPHSCTVWNPSLITLNYTNFNVSSEEGDALGHVLTIVHYKDKSDYESARDWVKSGTVIGDRPTQFFYVTESYGIFDHEPLINYSDERQEIAFIERYAQNKITAIRFNGNLGSSIDRYTIVSLSTESLNRLLQVPYGYDHLKPISVGDKLGLVYWDGTDCTEPGASMYCSTNDVYDVLVASYSPQDYGYGFKLIYNTTGKKTEPFLTKAGTVNLSGYDVKITGIETIGKVLLKDHLFHVI